MLFEPDEYSANMDQETGFISHFNESTNSSIRGSELDGELIGLMVAFMAVADNIGLLFFARWAALSLAVMLNQIYGELIHYGY